MSKTQTDKWRYSLLKSGYKKTTFSRYSIGLLLVLLTLLIKLIITPLFGFNPSLIPFLIPIIFSAWYGGIWPGVLATLLSVLICGFFFLEPTYSFKIDNIIDALNLGLFALVGFIVSSLSQSVMETTTRLINTLESISDSFFILDTRWRFRYINKHALNYFPGRDKRSLLNKNIWKEFPQAKKTLSYSKYKEATRKQKTLHYEEYISSFNRWLDFHIYPSKSGLSVYFTDITHRKLAEQKLKESENRFKELADHAPVMVWMTGSDKLCYYVNKGWLDFTGKKLQEELGYGWKSSLHPDDIEQTIDTYNSSFDARIDFQIEYRLKRFDEQYRWVLAQGVPRFTKSGHFLGYIGSAMDITERKMLEENKDDFVSVASHELKTPLTTLKAYSQLAENKLSKSEIDAEVKDYIKRMSVQIDHLNDLVADILDVSKIEKGKLNYTKKIFDLEYLVEEIIQDIQYTAPHHKIILKNGKDISIYADPLRISQVMTNLLTNAIKYSPNANKITVKIFKTKGAKNSITVAVKDYGIGVPKSEQQKIFERFYRISGEQRETISGFGLGLHITSEIIKRHGGTIWVESTPGKGSTFFFTLPTKNN